MSTTKYPYELFCGQKTKLMYIPYLVFDVVIFQVCSTVAVVLKGQKIVGDDPLLLVTTQVSLLLHLYLAIMWSNIKQGILLRGLSNVSRALSLAEKLKMEQPSGTSDIAGFELGFRTLRLGTVITKPHHRLDVGPAECQHRSKSAANDRHNSSLVKDRWRDLAYKTGMSILLQAFTEVTASAAQQQPPLNSTRAYP